MIASKSSWLREREADLVHEGQLGVALARLLDGAGPTQGRPDVLPDEGEQVSVGLRVQVLGVVGLDDDHAERLALGDERCTDPIAGAAGADRLDLAAGDSSAWPAASRIMGLPVRSTYAVLPAASPSPIGSQADGSGRSVSTVST